MLCRAVDLGGFHQVIFISHTPLVWEIAELHPASPRRGIVVANPGSCCCRMTEACGIANAILTARKLRLVDRGVEGRKPLLSANRLPEFLDFRSPEVLRSSVTGSPKWHSPKSDVSRVGRTGVRIGFTLKSPYHPHARGDN